MERRKTSGLFLYHSLRDHKVELMYKIGAAVKLLHYGHQFYGNVLQLFGIRRIRTVIAVQALFVQVEEAYIGIVFTGFGKLVRFSLFRQTFFASQREFLNGFSRI